MIVDEDRLRHLAVEAVEGAAGAPPRPLADVRARAAELRRRRRLAGGALGAAAVLAAAVAVPIVRGAPEHRTLTTASPAGSSPGPATTGAGRPREMISPELTRLALCGDLATGRPRSGSGGTVAYPPDAVPARLLALPDPALGGSLQASVGGTLGCSAPEIPTADWYRLKPGEKVVREGSIDQYFEVSGPDNPNRCSMAKALDWPFGGTRTRERARGVAVDVYRRSSRDPRVCAVWTEPDGRRWFAVSDTMDTPTMLATIGRLHLTANGADAGRALPGLVAGGPALSYRPTADGPERAFLETRGTAAGTDYTLAVLDAGDLPAFEGDDVADVTVGDAPGRWTGARATLLWKGTDDLWYVLRTASGPDAALRIATSLRPAPPDDPRWAVLSAGR